MNGIPADIPTDVADDLIDLNDLPAELFDELAGTAPAVRAASSRRPLRAVPTDEDTVGGQGAGDEQDGDEHDGRAYIEVSGNPDAIRKLKRAVGSGAIPDLYVTGGAPVRIERVSGTLAVDLDEDAPLPVVPTKVTGALLANLLAAHTYTFQTKVRKDEQGKPEFFREEITPPPPVLSAVLAGAEWPHTPTLAGIIGTPVLRRDWSLLQNPGYDPASGLYLAPTVALPPVPVRPSPAQVAKAREFVTSTLLGDFEWEDAASLANFVAMLVTPFLRRPLKALAPLAIVSASTASSGKSLLTGLVGLLVGQQVVPWPADNDVELEKLITATFTQESGAVIFDNIAEGEAISSPILANLLTNPMWSSRILGKTGMGAWVNDRLWMVTGNNLRVGGDIASRSVYIRLKPKAPHPETRTGFAIPDLQGWIMDPNHRAELLWRLLVLVADWVAAGTPRDTSTPPMRQFTPWAHGVGGFLTHHGITGFLTNLHVTRGMDEEDQKWAIFLGRWRERLGDKPLKVNAVLADGEIVRDFAAGHDVDPWDGDFITDERGRRPKSPQMLGRMLAGQVDRFHGDPAMTLRVITDSHAKANQYWVEEYQP
ncbi:hypothetical protein GCM10022223_47030 [Kineosporia mesophila]|uniref:DUF927 domain-containing protein n=1 Tax=Kineosporia mesophila TaxID=566012 RepID=A0ABP7A423_9ACTN|nr:hypothetical protein [Kineosporia mesophila]MCD5353811.1 hypothetical protein [Kineosporia mesophila]